MKIAKYSVLVLLSLVIHFNATASTSDNSGHAVLGITIISLESIGLNKRGCWDLTNVTYGVAVNSVRSDSSAEEAGLQTGDFILNLNGTKTIDPMDVFEKVRKSKPGSRFEITVMRKGVELRFEGTFGGVEQLK